MSTRTAFKPRGQAGGSLRPGEGGPLALVLLFAFGLVLPACTTDPAKGYSFSSTYDAGIASINVPIFENTTFSRGIETELAAALVAEVRKTTPWRVDQSDAAQTTLRGSITSSELRKISTARDSGLVEQLAVEITVDFEWKDNRTGKVLVGRRAFSAAEAFVPARGTSGPVNERLELGQHATIAELARAIMGELRSAW